MQKTVFTVASVLLLSSASQACPRCRPLVEAGVYNASFASNVFVVMLPLAVLLCVAFGAYFSEEAAAKIRKGTAQWKAHRGAARLFRRGF